jgi:hypothetical protein
MKLMFLSRGESWLSLTNSTLLRPEDVPGIYMSVACTHSVVVMDIFVFMRDCI